MPIRWTLIKPTTSRQNNSYFFPWGHIIPAGKAAATVLCNVTFFEGTTSYQNEAPEPFICENTHRVPPRARSHVNQGYSYQKQSLPSESRSNTQSSYRAWPLQARALPADQFPLPGDPFWPLPYAGFQLIGTCQGSSSFQTGSTGPQAALPSLLSTGEAWCSVWKVLPAAAAQLAHTALPCWDSKPSRCRQELKVPLHSYRPLLFLLLTSCVCPSLYWVSCNLGPCIPQFITFPCFC